MECCFASENFISRLALACYKMKPALAESEITYMWDVNHCLIKTNRAPLSWWHNLFIFCLGLTSHVLWKWNPGCLGPYWHLIFRTIDIATSRRSTIGCPAATLLKALASSRLGKNSFLITVITSWFHWKDVFYTAITDIGGLSSVALLIDWLLTDCLLFALRASLLCNSAAGYGRPDYLTKEPLFCAYSTIVYAVVKLHMPVIKSMLSLHINALGCIWVKALVWDKYFLGWWVAIYQYRTTIVDTIETTRDTIKFKNGWLRFLFQLNFNHRKNSELLMRWKHSMFWG